MALLMLKVACVNNTSVNYTARHHLVYSSWLNVSYSWLVVVVVVVGTIEQSNKLSSVIGHVTVILWLCLTSCRSAEDLLHFKTELWLFAFISVLHMAVIMDCLCAVDIGHCSARSSHWHLKLYTSKDTLSSGQVQGYLSSTRYFILLIIALHLC